MAKSRGTILVVDDELDLRKMIEVGLELDGYRVLTAASGAQALDLARNNPVDLVISDIAMPGMNGLETIARLRELVPRVPVIVATGFDGPNAFSECEALGDVAVILKPFEFRALVDAVDAAVGARAS